MPFEKGPEEVEKYVNYLEERIAYLEEVNRFTLDALEMAASLGDFQTSINKLQEPSIILNETRAKVQSLIQFKTLGFFMVDETDNDFYLAMCEPQECQNQLHEEMDLLIEDGNSKAPFYGRAKATTISTVAADTTATVQALPAFSNSQLPKSKLSLYPPPKRLESSVPFAEATPQQLIDGFSCRHDIIRYDNNSAFV